MSFFVTSAGLGQGGDLGGLAGADAHCTRLAELAVGPAPAGRSWRAYLSTQTRGGVPGVSARERIGVGPWHNAKGALIARSVDELHGAANGINNVTALSERGEPTPGRWHDILTGTRPDGHAPSPLDPDLTCGNWTQQAPAGGAALVGHHDRVSAIKEPWASSWNSAHQSRGCSTAALQALGSGGLFYCFMQ